MTCMNSATDEMMLSQQLRTAKEAIVYSQTFNAKASIRYSKSSAK